MMIILNAFSPNMVETPGHFSVHFTAVRSEVARDMIIEAGSIESAVGHADTAAVFSQGLDLHVAYRRSSVTLQDGDTAVLGQYKGERLPEGATELPPGSRIDWYLVRIEAQEHPIW